ncbi:MAG: thioesterase domain-containing protein [Pseudomonadota bacterium]|nr:thioesterase domain-containing protein [Pseudomonadota bacterium]
MQPTDPNVVIDRKAREEASKKLSHTIYHDTLFERKFRPNICFWIKELPQTKRNKISRTLNDYQELDPKRLLLPTKQDQNDETINNLIKIWSTLLEGDLVAIDSNELHYDIDASFTHLGGDSLMMSQMIQMVWESLGHGDTPAPNDFARAIIYNPTLNGIKHFLSLYNYQAIQLQYTNDAGLPVFAFLKLGENCLLTTTYNINLPEQDASISHNVTMLKTLMIVLKRQCRQTQPVGPYHFICDENNSNIAYELARAFAELGEQVYLTFVATHYECDAIPRLVIEHCNGQNELSAIITNTQVLRIDQSIAEKLAQIMQSFLKSAPPFLANNSPTQDHLTDFLHAAKSKETFWLVGPAGSGKTTLIQSGLKLCASKNVLPLDIAGMTAHNLFEEALLKIVPRWQWPYLQAQHFTLIVDGYDRLARFDCPDIWQQAEKLGFTNISWIISCREVYWQIYSKIILQYQKNTPWHIHKQSVTQLEFAPIAAQLGVPATHAALQCHQKISAATLDEQRFNWFMAWWQRDYHYYKPATSLDSFTQKAFTTLDILCKEYVKNGLLPITLQPSHWQLYLDKPSVQALPFFQSVLSILPLENLTPELYENLLTHYLQHQTEQTSQTLSEKLQNKLYSIHTEEFWEKFDNKAHARYHILPLQVIPSSTPLFIFHPLTGETPVSYRKLGEAFPLQTIYALQMGPHDYQTSSLEKAELYLQYIKTIQPTGPYLLMGWSFGVAVAFHVAYLLEQQGEIVDTIINIDSPPPQFIATIAPEERAKDMIIQLTKTVYNVPFDEQLFLSVLQPNMSTIGIFAKAIDFIKQLPDSSKYENCLQALTKANLNLQVYHDFANWCNIENPKLNAKLYVFEATIKRASLNNTAFDDWQTYAHTHIQPLEGNHFELFNAVLFNYLAPLLKEYQANTVLPLDERLALHCSRVLCQEFANVIPAMADIELNGKAPFTLDDHLINVFLNNDQEPATQCFLLQGEPGSGKSLYASLLEHKCWELGSHFPLRITLKPGGNNLVKSSLLKIGLTEQEYNELKVKLLNTHDKRARQSIIQDTFGAPLLIIFDGYDEAFSQENLFLKENLSLWAAIAFISCRHYAVNSFKISEQFGDDNGRLFTAFLQPFTMTEAEDYLTLHEKTTGSKFDRDVLTQAPDTTMLQNPLLLSLAIQFWSEIPKVDNRAALYRRFFTSLFERYQAQLQISEGIRPTVNLMVSFAKYCQRLATEAYYNIENNGSTLSTSIEKIADNTDTTQVKKAKHFITNDDGGLSHITYWEFQLANALITAMNGHDFSKLDSTSVKILTYPTLSQNISLLEMIRDLARMLPFEEFDRFRQKLLLTVYASRFKHEDSSNDTIRVHSATNAISILNVMRVPFSGLDLHSIRVPGAYLCNALFHRANLQNANLSNARIQFAFFEDANLNGATLEGSINPIKHLHSRPLTSMTTSSNAVIAMAHANKVGLLAVGMGSNIELFTISPNASMAIRLKIFVNKDAICNLALSEDGQTLISCERNQSGIHTIKIWDVKLCKCLESFIFENDHLDELNERSLPKMQYIRNANINLLVLLGNIDNEFKISLYEITKTCQAELITEFKVGHSYSQFQVHPTKPLLFAADTDFENAKIHTWSLETLSIINSVTLDFEVPEISISPNGEYLIVFDSSTLHIRDSQSLQIIHSSKLKLGDTFKYAFFSYDNTMIIAYTCEGTVSIWDTQSFKLITTLHTGVYDHNFTLSKDNRHLVFIGPSGILSWDLRSLSAQLQNTPRVELSTTNITGNKICLLETNRDAKIICMKTFSEIKFSVPFEAQTLDFSSDGEDIIISTEYNIGKILKVWNINQRKYTLSFAGIRTPIRDATSIAIDENRSLIGVGYYDGRLEIWSIASSSTKHQFQLGTDELCYLKFNLGADQIIGCNTQGTLFIQDLVDNKIIQFKSKHKNAICHIDFSPDKSNFVTVSKPAHSSNGAPTAEFIFFYNSNYNMMSKFEIEYASFLSMYYVSPLSGFTERGIPHL